VIYACNDMQTNYGVSAPLQVLTGRLIKFRANGKCIVIALLKHHAIRTCEKIGARLHTFPTSLLNEGECSVSCSGCFILE
jgi:hypothetical protein